MKTDDHLHIFIPFSEAPPKSSFEVWQKYSRCQTVFFLGEEENKKCISCSPLRPNKITPSTQSMAKIEAKAKCVQLQRIVNGHACMHVRHEKAKTN